MASVLALLAVAALVWFAAPARAGDVDKDLQTRQYGSCSGEDGLGVMSVGLGLDQITGAAFNVNLPASATVAQAWLYWNGDDDGNNLEDDPNLFDPNLHDGDPTVTLDGAQVPNPERIGGPANWGGVQNTYAYGYRSDVSSIVTGNGSYVFDGVDNFFGEQGYNNGAELVIIYSQASRAPHHVGIADGLDLAYGTNGPNVGPGTKAAMFNFEPGSGKRQANVSVFLGGAGLGGKTALWYMTGSVPPEFPNNVQIAGKPGAVKLANVFTGLQNQNASGYWDSYDFSVTVPATAKWLAVQIISENEQPRPILEWVGATMQMEMNCNLDLFLPMLLK
ncbi:MAG: DUF3344 domain-containing protein [Caldilineales bacterium]|nr:DUF3344 domain-containing protein [Caldilineales bacterium]